MASAHNLKNANLTAPPLLRELTNHRAIQIIYVEPENHRRSRIRNW